MKPDQDISLVPISLGEANEYMAKHIRQYRPAPGCKFSVGCALDGELVGAAIVGRCEEAQYSPVDSARMSDVYAEGVEFVSRIEAIVKR